MLYQYAESRAFITMKILYADFDDKMIQDAVGIITFPSYDPYDMYNIYPTSDPFNSWKAQLLRKPLQTDHNLSNELEKLHGRLLLFIEDYLTKATAT